MEGKEVDFVVVESEHAEIRFVSGIHRIYDLGGGNFLIVGYRLDFDHGERIGVIERKVIMSRETMEKSVQQFQAALRGDIPPERQVGASMLN